MEVNSCTKISPNNDLSPNTCLADELPAKLDQAIKKIIKKEGFITYKIDKENVSTNNSNYLGILYGIDIKGKTKNGDKEISIFVKNIKPDKSILQIISITDVYKIELFAYKQVFKLYEKMQEEAHIPLDERFKMVKVYDESNEETIIMENLARKGFKICKRMSVASLQFAKLAIKALAKFHGLSFVLKEKRSKFFEENIKPIDYPVIFNEAWPPFVEKMKNITMEFVDEEYKKRVEAVYAGLEEKFPRYHHDTNSRVCLCHGDYTPNNILMRMGNDQEHEVIPVDYQLMHYGCPVSDFFYFIYFCTDRDFRKKHMIDLKNLYYDELKHFVKYFNFDIDSVYPRNEFEKAYKEKLDYGLMLSLLYLVFMFVSDDKDVEPDVVGLNFQIDDRFKERLRGALVDYEEWGYL